eukprot:m.70350 g.70350  ORF g.70350 m.70350 type:complete len:471 (-) comp24212_c1_seq2:15-1427(-)
MSQDQLSPEKVARYARVAQMMKGNPEIDTWVEGLANKLKEDSFVLADDFLEKMLAIKIAVEVKKAWKSGRLESGELAGGRSGANKKYTLDRIRGDKVGWFSGDPCDDTTTGRKASDITGMCWQGDSLQVLMRRIGTIVQMISSKIVELQGIGTRSEAMVTCYPGDGARYIRHCDNPHKNGRKLTVIYYLNHNWTKGDGGELRIFKPDDTHIDIDPIGDRLVVFFSDERVPHEVLATNVERFAITHWFYDEVERDEAEAAATDGKLLNDRLIEQRRIEKEILKFEAEAGAKALVSKGIAEDLLLTKGMGISVNDDDVNDGDGVTPAYALTTSFCDPHYIDQSPPPSPSSSSPSSSSLSPPPSSSSTPSSSECFVRDVDVGHPQLRQGGTIITVGATSAAEVMVEINKATATISIDCEHQHRSFHIDFQISNESVCDIDGITATFLKAKSVLCIKLPSLQQSANDDNSNERR